MRKYIHTLALFLLPVTGLHARDTGGVDFGNVSVATDNETVWVSFRAGVGAKTAIRGVTIVYAPVITDGQYKVSLPPIVVQGGRAKKNWQRHQWAADIEAEYADGIYTKGCEVLEYRAGVPFQPWMHGARIDIETVTAWCCDTRNETFELVAGILPAPPAPEPVAEPEPAPEPAVAEYMAETLPFVLPVSDFDPDEPVKLYHDERDNALSIYYRVGSHRIEEDYAGNCQTLVNLLAAIRLIRESGNAQVQRVVVAGFSSPDGSFEANDYLAWQRAVSIGDYIAAHTDLPKESMTLVNGSVDWSGLRLAILADPNVPSRTEVLDIIDNRPVWDPVTRTGRQTLLQRLDGGAPYRYMAEHIFPLLRNAAFIRVYFEVATATPIVETSIRKRTNSNENDRLTPMAYETQCDSVTKTKNQIIHKQPIP